MFTIDLLKGQAVPMRNRPEGIAIGVIALLVPVVAAIAMFGLYVGEGIAKVSDEREITRLDKEIAKLQDALELRKSFEQEKVAIAKSLLEVESSINRHTQWTPILVSVVKNLPKSLVLMKLQVKENSIKKEVKDKDDPEKTVEISIPVRVLQMSIKGDSKSNCDNAVKEFCDTLRNSTQVRPRPKKVEISDVDVLEESKMVLYEIDCVFEPIL